LRWPGEELGASLSLRRPRPRSIQFLPPIWTEFYVGKFRQPFKQDDRPIPASHPSKRLRSGCYSISEEGATKTLNTDKLIRKKEKNKNTMKIER
jgi:hypothetical protein